MSRWLRTDLRSLVDEYLAPNAVRRQGYFQGDMVTHMVQDHREGRVDYSRNIWALLMFALWAEGAGVRV
jgi:asparagine synthase (glutamine-hydrolysing)